MILNTKLIFNTAAMCSLNYVPIESSPNVSYDLTTLYKVIGVIRVLKI